MDKIPSWLWPMGLTMLVALGGLIIDVRADGRVAKVTPRIDRLQIKQNTHETRISVIESKLSDIKENTEKAKQAAARSERMLIQLSVKMNLPVPE